MFGNIWLSSALIVTAIFSASAIYKSYSDIQAAKQIQESYQIISDIKTLLAKQYNKNPQDITRDEIIASLPSAGNWEKILLTDRNDSSGLANKALINEDGNLVLNENERIKLLALRAKLKNITDTNSITAVNNTLTFEVGKLEENSIEKDKEIERNIELAINYLVDKLLYDSAVTSSTITTEISSAVALYLPESDIYQDLKTSVDEAISDTELLSRKKTYFQNRIKDELSSSNDTIKTKLYNLIKEQI